MMEISILLLTYNHERFVKQALDSILMQKINVSYEIIILDDASTDKTPDILEEYKSRYPEKISLYLRETNSGHATKNSYFMLSKAKGKYFAFLEGDDYWIDEFKIQKQYDILKEHKEYSACTTDLIVVDEENNKISEHVYEPKENNVFTLEDFRHLKIPGMTLTFFARNYFEKKEFRILYKADKMMGDITVYMLYALKGDIYQLNEKTAAYRYVCTSGQNNFNSIHRNNIYKDYMQARYWIKLENYIRKKHDRKFEFISMLYVLEQIVYQYPMKVVLNLIRQADNKWKYFLIYFIYKCLLESNFLLEKANGKKYHKHYSWTAFKRDNLPLVLFGSGAVAAEYIDKYAWENNILFIVDNDIKKQNLSYKGFLIKKPEEILKYKNKINVLIVNQYSEKDIVKQLRDMHISSFYCYCSMQTNRLRNIVAKKILECFVWGKINT